MGLHLVFIAGQSLQQTMPNLLNLSHHLPVLRNNRSILIFFNPSIIFVRVSYKLPSFHIRQSLHAHLWGVYV